MRRMTGSICCFSRTGLHGNTGRLFCQQRIAPNSPALRRQLRPSMTRQKSTDNAEAVQQRFHASWHYVVHIYTYIRLIITYDRPHSGTMTYAVTLRNSSVNSIHSMFCMLTGEATWNTFSSVKKMKSESVSENLSSSRRDRSRRALLFASVSRWARLSCSTWEAGTGRPINFMLTDCRCLLSAREAVNSYIISYIH